uniref:Uncharacterized protein LOC114338835 n=1 Tax=Diabrotica virgifera virgifera TaxID=50390 RepID=A0A6P7G871_DIAVI
MILNVFKTEIQENPTKSKSAISIRVADKTGVCSRSVRNIVQEYENTGTLSTPKQIKQRRSIINSLDDLNKEAIRRIIHQFFFRNEIPTTEKVLRVVNEDPVLSNFKRTTFFKLLKEINFKFQRRQRNSIFMDRDEIVSWRRECLIKIKAYRNENRKIYYLDETWLNAGHTKSKVWVDNSVTSYRQAFLDGLSTGLKNPAGKGKRLIICHIGSEDGFVPEALWVLESKKSVDYHEEMDEKSFENWFKMSCPD